jgi:hypothetical protein
VAIFLGDASRAECSSALRLLPELAGGSDGFGVALEVEPESRTGGFFGTSEALTRLARGGGLGTGLVGGGGIDSSFLAGGGESSFLAGGGAIELASGRAAGSSRWPAAAQRSLESAQI